MIPPTFNQEIPGIGSFTFRKRTMADQLAIAGATEEMLAGLVGPERELVAEALATLPRLTIACPPNWTIDLSHMDPLDPVSWALAGAVFGGLRQAEDRFRGKPPPERPSVGPSPVGDGGV